MRQTEYLQETRKMRFEEFGMEKLNDIPDLLKNAHRKYDQTDNMYVYL